MFEKEAEDNKPPYAYCSFNTKCELCMTTGNLLSTRKLTRKG